MSLSAIILAAGKSTRMKSSKPKPLHEVCGKPMLHYILQACFGAGVEKIVVVVGYGKEEVIAAFGNNPRVAFVEQTEQLGTGHAVRVCEPELRKLSGDVFILAGDLPLTRSQVLKTLAEVHHSEDAAASMATAVLDDPTGYGRIVRDKKGEFLDIVEQLDCTPEQREIREVFPSYYCARIPDLLIALSKLTNSNKKSEYYLTDIFDILRRDGKKIAAVQAVEPDDVIAPNTRQQLAEADMVMQDRIQRSFRDSGVSIPNPLNTYIEADAQIGRDTIIHPFSFIGRDAEIGNDCTIGPFGLVTRGSIVPDRANVIGNISSDSSSSYGTGSR